MTDAEIIDGIIARESPTYTNRADDLGGPTKFGIDLATLTAWRSKPTTAVDVENLSSAEARRIYEHKYIQAPGFDKIAADEIRVQVIDFGVTSGPKTSARVLQSVLDLPADGDIGPETIAKANNCDVRTVANKFACERAKFYGRIVAFNSSQHVNLNGWLNRALGFVQ